MYLEDKVKQIKEICLEMCIAAGKGHVTSAFSCAEIVTVLYYDVMCLRPKEPRWEDRDRFIMSKNHGSVITFPILDDMGFLEGMPPSFLEDNTFFGPHSKIEIPGVDFSGGALGIGLGMACGLAYAAKTDEKGWCTFCLVGDGECHEGAIWEAAMFAGHNRLGNLVAIIDRNMLCMTDQTEKILQLEPLAEKWEAFGWEVRQVDGHDVVALQRVFKDVHLRTDTRPLCVLAHTTKGNGVNFMKDDPFWHGVAPKGEQADEALEQVRSGGMG